MFMRRRTLLVFLFAMSASVLTGCVAVAVTGAVTGASVATDRRTAGTILDDETIELKAHKAFFEDKGLHDQAHLNVTSYNNVVLLTGEAPTRELRSHAVDIVRNIRKVKRVIDEVKVAAPSSFVSRSSDSLITSKVKTKLLAAKNISGINVKVVTEDGVVYLMGLVSKAEGNRAADVASRTGGVQRVVKLFQYTD
jgi:osmotically-inducible protein OsmY